MHHGVTFSFGSAKVCSPAIFETCSVFALVKTQCETDCLPSFEKTRQLLKNVRHVLHQDILGYQYFLPIWDCLKSTLFK